MLSASRAIVRAVVLALVTAMLALGFSSSATAAPRQAAGSPAKSADPSPAIHGVNGLADADATISGLVYDADGELLDNIEVDAFSADDPTGDVVASDLTYEYQDVGSHGAFRLHVPAGTYLIRFSSPDFAEKHVYETVYYGGGAGDHVTVASGDTATLEDTTLVTDVGAPAGGTVLDAADAPLPGVDVLLVRIFGGEYYRGVARAVTDEDGAYTFASVRHRGDYSVLAYGGWSEDDEQLNLPNTWLGDVPGPGMAATFTHPAGSDPYALGPIHLRPGSELHGSYVPATGDDENSYYDASLYVRKDDGTLGYIGSTYLDDASHAFSFPAVMRGYDYTVGVYDYDAGAETFLGDGTSRDAATTVPVGSADTSVDVGAIRAGVQQSRVRGSVLDQQGDGVSYAGLVVWERHDDGTWEDVSYRSTRDNGDYSLRLPWGHTYTVEVGSSDEGGTFLGDVTDIDAADRFTPTEGEPVLTLDPITLPQAGGDKVRGQVVDAAGNPVDGASVSLYSDYCPDTGGCWLDDDSVSTGANGRYVFRDVEPGRSYVVSAQKYDAGFGEIFAGQKSRAADATVYTVPAEGGVVDVDDIRLNVSELTGSVLDDEGNGLNGARVTLWSQYCEGVDCWDTWDSTTTDADGHYTFERVDTGRTYTVSASKRSAGFPETFVGGTTDPSTATSYTQPEDGGSTPVDDIGLTLAAGVVRGVIHTSDDVALDGETEVDLYRLVDYGDGDYELQYVDETYTEDSDYGFTDVQPGQYTTRTTYYPNRTEDGSAPHQYLRGGWRGGARPTGPDSPGVFTVDAAINPTDGIDITLQRGVELGGTATATASGSPLSDVEVDVYEWVDTGSSTYLSYVGYGYTDDDGHYSVRVPQNTDVYVSANRGGYQSFYLGGVDYPYEKTPDNSLSIGADDRAFDFSMAPAPRAVTDPVITGTPAPGETLTATSGTWELDGQPAEGLTFSYYWYNVTGVTDGATYVVQPNDAGRRIRVRVTASLEGYDDQYAYSESVKIPAGPPVATNTAPPSLSPPDPAVGDLVTADPGTWEPVDGTQDDLTFGYRWFREGRRIHGESASTYEVRQGDELTHLFVRVVAKRAGYANVTADSAPITAADKPVVEQVTAPALSGSPKVGNTLTIEPGDWDADGEEITYAYKWTSGYQVRNADAGSDGRAYTLTASDRDKLLTVLVTASAPGHRKATWTRTVGPVVAADVSLGSLTVSVLDDASSAPISGATVWGCDSYDWSCFPAGQTDDSGAFTVQVRNGASYYLSVDAGDEIHHGAQLYTDTPATGDKTQVVRLTKPTPPPPNVSIPSQNGTYDGVPQVYYGDPQRFNVSGCSSVVDPRYTVTFSDGHAPMTAPMTPTGTPAGDLVTFTALIPAFYPVHGDATISTNIPADCAPGTPGTVVSIYIDPSGVVTDQYGRPIEGATVTLSRSDLVGGPYVEVPDGSDIMSPSNRSNPDTTDSIGFFQWDVSDGWYEVKAAAPGCTTVTTSPMQVPPIQVDLLIKLDCTAPAPSSTPVVTGGSQVGGTLGTTNGWSNLYTVTNQWKRDGSPIVGETGASYVLTSADAGHDITVTQTADRPDYTQEVGRGGPVDFTAATATSEPRTVSNADAPTAAAPTLHGTARTGQQMTVDEPVWSAAGVTSSYQWLRDGSPIAGATSSGYTLTAADVSHQVAALVTGTRPGYADGSVSSASVTGQLGDAVSATTAPAVTGTAAVGQTLTTTSGTWPDGVTLTRQWLRDGTAVAGATGATYGVTVADVGHAVSVLVTATRAGYADGTSRSNAVSVAKVASKTAGKLSAAKVKAGKKVVYTVTVKATGVAGPTGKLKVYDGRKVIKTLALPAKAKGVVKVTLKKLKKGKHKLSAKYLGSTSILASASKVSKLKVK